ncbi:ABC transporter ATP-binding protein [Brevibacterium luteolum]|uniref:Spermidine/putrescine import ATP-binding protein PotA n=1 Tax=Brevibacterium luteolum TaxID=199591 RepID=A0A6G8KY37_9MICO|nr:polyamine ABC transporter ATP-binding protein [Brevibacterium luteolum]QIN29728.1 polyamine ABC transporter ATP-binding protein [Brevibacterium luteolum]
MSAHTETTAAQPAGTGQAAGQLEIRGVTKRFGSHTALSELDLTVEAGEFLSLLGPSGCGKTTLLRMIAGFEEPTTGHILLSDQDLVGVPAHRRPVNTVFQSYALFPHMSVSDNVAYGLKQKRVPKAEIRERVIEALRLVQMDGFADRKPDQLSGGQQQRVALARALVNRPQVLLLDEPMSALDRKLREEMQIELKRLHAELGMTFVFVTHDQEEALAMSDRIVVLNAGKIQQVGTAEEIYSRPANRFVAGFIGKQNFVSATLESIDGETAVLRSARSRITVPAGLLGPDAKPGDAVEAAVRPEIIDVTGLDGTPGDGGGSEGAELTDAVDGEIVGVSFLGDVVQYIVKLRDGHEVLARVPALASDHLGPGARVRLSWGRNQAQVFCDG